MVLSQSRGQWLLPNAPFEERGRTPVGAAVMGCPMTVANRHTELELTRPEKIGVAIFVMMVVAIMVVAKIYH
jgi:hypothetical protein